MISAGKITEDDLERAFSVIKKDETNAEIIEAIFKKRISPQNLMDVLDWGGKIYERHAGEEPKALALSVMMPLFVAMDEGNRKAKKTATTILAVAVGLLVVVFALLLILSFISPPGG